MALRAGDTFGHYTIDGDLGEGGMGRVFRAYDPRLHRYVALKIVRSRQEDAASSTSDLARRRLLNEARAAAALDHPNAVSIFDVGESDGTPFVAMELVRGRPLSDYVGDDSLPIATRVRWLADVARALAAAHERGLVHRDIKPGNVMVREDGVVKVLDFGIARRVRLVHRDDDAPSTLTGDHDVLTFEAVSPIEPEKSSDARAAPGDTLAALTGAGAVVGTPLYMAPEQMRGEAVDARADQFAWGVLAYELLAGAKPWGSTPTLSTLSAALTSPAPPLVVRSGEVSAEIDAVIRRVLSKDRADRFASMRAVVDALDSIGQPATMRHAPRAMYVVAVAVCVVVIGLAAFRSVTSSARPASVLSSERSSSVAMPASTVVASVVEPSTRETTAHASSAASFDSPSSAPPSTRESATVAPTTSALVSARVAVDAGSTVPVAASPKQGCNPNYVLDSEGEKHFKPECFTSASGKAQ
jgi:serine/threonine-protein kinase